MLVTVPFLLGHKANKAVRQRSDLLFIAGCWIQFKLNSIFQPNVLFSPIQTQLRIKHKYDARAIIIVQCYHKRGGQLGVELYVSIVNCF